MKNKLMRFLMICMALLTIAGCAAQNVDTQDTSIGTEPDTAAVTSDTDTDTQTADDGEEPKEDGPQTPDTWYESEKYSKYINYRKPLSNTFNKLNNDKELTVLYFGGSVTAGTGVSNREQDSWRAKVGNWIKTSFPSATVTNINRAVGESGTYLGAYRVQRDVIAHAPDLIFLEYSINDNYYKSSYDDAYRQYETIVREIKQALPTCDIVTVLVTDRNFIADNMEGNLHIQAQAHEDVSKLYNIPSVHVGRLLSDTVKDRETWSNYATDGVHLNAAGYEVYFSCLKEYLNNALRCTKHSSDMLTDTLPAVSSASLFDGDRQLYEMSADIINASEALGGTGFEFKTGGFYAPSNPVYMHDYTTFATASTADSIFAFKFKGTELAMFTNFYGSYIEVSVDGGGYTRVKCSSHNPTKIVEGLSSGEHIVRIKPVFDDGRYTDIKICVLYSMDTTKETLKGTL